MVWHPHYKNKEEFNNEAWRKRASETIKELIKTDVGLDIKNLQYVMGYSDVGVTLNVYTHASYDRAAEQMAKIVDFKEADTRERK